MIRRGTELRRAFFASATALALASAALYAATAGKWEPITASKGISVFKRETPNSSMFEFVATGLVDAPIPKIISQLQEIRLMTEWVEDCKKGEQLFKNYDENSVKMAIGDYRMIIYGVQGAPWPITDRDYVLNGRISYDAKNDAAILDLHEAKHPKRPEQSGLVRMNFMRVRLTLTPKNKDRSTQVKFYVHVDPGGLLPAWAVNFVTKKVPYNSILKLRELVKRQDHNRKIEKMVADQMKKLRAKRPKSKDAAEEDDED